jgi:adenine C2-methylase RlmN of 23S rRNA A2503 and tRNA A37
MPNEEIHQTRDGTVFKIVHPDGSETAIKDVSGCGGLGEDARNKYSVFASCSRGCKLSCKFCMLHTKGVKYERLTSAQVLGNLKRSLAYVAEKRPSIREKGIKLSWMGMGEAMKDPRLLLEVSISFLAWALNEGYATGIDCLDIGTAFHTPDEKRYTYVQKQLSSDLFTLVNTPERDRPYVRYFISVGAIDDETRHFLIGSGDFTENVDYLRKMSRHNVWAVPGTLICHLLLLKGVNDSPAQLMALDEFFRKRPDLQLRLLRYNQCDGSPFEESPVFDLVAERFLRELPDVKIQTSPGSEVMAACGQFLV